MLRNPLFWLWTVLLVPLGQTCWPSVLGAAEPPLMETAQAANFLDIRAILALPSVDDERIGGSAVVIGAGQACSLQEAFAAPVVPGTTVTLLLFGGERRPATVVRTGTTTTAVLLALDTHGLTPLVARAPTPLGLGTAVWTVGNSSGALEDDGVPAVSRGTLSGRYALSADGLAVRGRGGRILSLVHGPMLEIDAAINDGNQGGAVFDDHGHLIGLASLAVARERRLGTAVPIDRVFAELNLPPPPLAAVAAPAVQRAALPAGLVLIAFDRPTGLGNPNGVPRPSKTSDQVPGYERERLENWWDSYHHNQQILWTDTPAPAVIIDADRGLLLTAASHLHGDAVAGRLLVHDGKTIAVRVLAVDTPLDLVLLVAEHPLSLPAAVIAPVTPALGAAVAVIAPFAQGVTRTAGHVTCVGRRLAHADQGFLQLDARAGYSSLGGAVVNDQGTVVGIVVKAGPTFPWYVNSGVTLAISGATIAQALPALRAGISRKELPRLAMGVVSEPRDGQLILLKITPGSGAAAAGLVAGDVLLTVDGRPARSHDAVTRALLRYHIGDRVRVEFRRGGRPLVAEVELREVEVGKVEPVEVGQAEVEQVEVEQVEVEQVEVPTGEVP